MRRVWPITVASLMLIGAMGALLAFRSNRGPGKAQIPQARLVREFPRPHLALMSTALSPDGKHLAFAGLWMTGLNQGERRYELLDLATGSVFGSDLPQGKPSGRMLVDGVEHLRGSSRASSPGFDRFPLTGDERLLGLDDHIALDLDTGGMEPHVADTGFPPPFKRVPHLEAGGKVLAYISGGLHVFDASTGHELRTLIIPKEQQLTGQWDYVSISQDGSACALSLSETRGALDSREGPPMVRRVIAWKTDRPDPSCTLDVDPSASPILHFSTDGSLLFIGRGEGTDVWDLDRARLARHLPTRPPSGTSTTTLDGHQIIGLIDDPKLARVPGSGIPELDHQAPLRLGAWNGATGQLLAQLDVPSKGSELSLDRVHGLLLTANEQGVQIWDIHPLMDAR